MFNINMFERNKCVLCNDMDLIYINELDYPVNDCINKDEINPIIKLKYGYCNYCYSVQLMNLLDAPYKLYIGRPDRPLQTEFYRQRGLAGLKFNLN